MAGEESGLNSFCLLVGMMPRVGADFLKKALGAEGSRGLAEGAPMEDEHVAEENPLLLGEKIHEVLLNLFGVMVAREADPLGDPADVGVYHDAFCFVEGIP